MLDRDGEQYDNTGGCPKCGKTSGKRRWGHGGRIKGDADRSIIKRNSSGTRERCWGRRPGHLETYQGTMEKSVSIYLEMKLENESNLPERGCSTCHLG